MQANDPNIGSGSNEKTMDKIIEGATRTEQMVSPEKDLNESDHFNDPNNHELKISTKKKSTRPIPLSFLKSTKSSAARSNNSKVDSKLTGITGTLR